MTASDNRFPQPEDVYAQHGDPEPKLHHEETIEEITRDLRQALNMGKARRTQPHYSEHSR